jgi:hypothetical protein
MAAPVLGTVEFLEMSSERTTRCHHSTPAQRSNITMNLLTGSDDDVGTNLNPLPMGKYKTRSCSSEQHILY